MRSNDIRNKTNKTWSDQDSKDIRTWSKTTDHKWDQGSYSQVDST